MNILLQSQSLDDDVKSAEEKFAESLQHAQIGMFHLLENDVRRLIIDFFT
jgi:endophilin-A